MRRFINFVVQDALPADLEYDETSIAPSNPVIDSSAISPPSARVSRAHNDSHAGKVQQIHDTTKQQSSTYGSFDNSAFALQAGNTIEQPLPLNGENMLKQAPSPPPNPSPRKSIQPPVTNARTATSPTILPSTLPPPPKDMPNDNPLLTTSAEMKFRNLIDVLMDFARRGSPPLEEDGELRLYTSPTAVVNALKELAEVVVWSDQNHASLWDVFMECSVMPLLVRCLHASLIPSVSATSQPDFSNGAIFKNDRSNKSELANGHVADDASMHDGNTSKPPVSKPDTTPLLPVANGVPANGASAMHQSIDFQSATMLDSSSLQDMVIVVPEQSFSAPVAANEGVEEGFYDTFRSSQSTPTLLQTNTERSKPPMDKSLAVAVQIQSQILQTLSIIVQSVSRQESLLCLFSSNHINDILSFPYSFDNDEMLGLLMSLIKTITLKLDSNLLQLFFNPTTKTFTLYSVVIRFYNHPESMVRIAVRNVTLTLCSLNDTQVLSLIASDDTKYLQNSVSLLKKLCGSVARAFDLLLDDGREVRRTRSRTWLFRHTVRISDVSGKLEEIENLCAYFSDLAALSESHLRPVVIRLLITEVLAPLFRPIASHACPDAMRQMQRNIWTLSVSEAYPMAQKPALAWFDAAARTLLLAFLLSCSKSSAVGNAIVQELACPALHFENRHVFHALKAICAHVGATERVAFITLLAIEAVLDCDFMTVGLMKSLDYGFEGRGKESDAQQREKTDHVDGVLEGEGEGEERDTPHMNENGEMVMTLKGFDVPMTPSHSMPTTPTTPSTPAFSPGSQERPPSLLFRALSSSNVADGNANDPKNEQDMMASLQTGSVSLGKVLISIVLVVRRREVRTKRLISSVCRIMFQVGERTKDWDAVADVSKTILNELATSLKQFLKNKNTTIVAIEGIFDHFTQAAEAMRSIEEYKSRAKEDFDIARYLTVDRLPGLVTEIPRGAGKRRRANGTGGTTAPVEIEDAEAVFAIMRSYELALKNANNGASVVSISDATKGALEECTRDDSYLDKRDALESVADIIIRHGHVA